MPKWMAALFQSVMEHNMANHEQRGVLCRCWFGREVAWNCEMYHHTVFSKGHLQHGQNLTIYSVRHTLKTGQLSCILRKNKLRFKFNECELLFMGLHFLNINCVMHCVFKERNKW